MEEINRWLLELEDDLFSELEEENDQEIRIQHLKIDNLLSELDKIRIEKVIESLDKKNKLKIEEITRISKENGCVELDGNFWKKQPLGVLLLIFNIYNSKKE